MRDIVRTRSICFVALLIFLSLGRVCAASISIHDWTRLSSLPDPLGVAGAFAGVSRGGLLVAGGANFPNARPWEGGKKVWHNNVWLLDRPDGLWREIGKLPRPLGYGVCVTTPDGVVCVGGSDADRHYPNAFRLFWNGDQLITEPLPPLPIPLSGASGALVRETLYVACGSEQPGERLATSRTFALDLRQKPPVWRELRPLPGKPRLLAVGAAHADSFYVIGGAALAPQPDGRHARVYLRETWRYRAVEGWERLVDLPKPIVAAPSPAPVVDGRILILSGDDGSHVGFKPPERHPGFGKSIFAYEIRGDRWVRVGEIPAARVTTPVVEWLGMFVVPSGEARPGVRSPEVWGLRIHDRAKPKHEHEP